MESPWVQCRCGGSYRLITDPPHDTIDVEHTLPTCRDWREANTSEEVLAYSQRNRAALAPI